MATLSIGVIAYVFTRKPLKRERMRAMRQRIRDSYATAAVDPEFIREIEEVDRAFDVTVGDGLEPESFAA